MFKIEFYECENGEVPVEEFLNSLDKKMRAKLIGTMKILEEHGNSLREPYSKHLENGIFEVRGKVGSDISRVLFFFYIGNRIIFTNGFIKKTNQTPKAEIDKAKAYRLNFIERRKTDEITR